MYVLQSASAPPRKRKATHENGETKPKTPRKARKPSTREESAPAGPAKGPPLPRRSAASNLLNRPTTLIKPVSNFELNWLFNKSLEYFSVMYLIIIIVYANYF